MTRKRGANRTKSQRILTEAREEATNESSAGLGEEATGLNNTPGNARDVCQGDPEDDVG